MIGIFQNNIKIGLSDESKPCLDNLGFWGKRIVGNNYVDKTGLLAPLKNSNCIYLNGTNAKAEASFSNDILYYLDRFTIKYSVDGTTLQTWTTGNAAIAGLFQIDLANRKLIIGYDGSVYKTMYLNHVILEYNNGVQYIPFNDFTFCSGSATVDYNRTTNEDEWEDRLFPMFGAIKDTTILNLKI